MFYHRDILKRSFRGTRDDRFLNPKDGRPKELTVQCTNDVLDTESEASWTRTRVRNKSPWLFRVAYWGTEKGAIVKWLSSPYIPCESHLSKHTMSRRLNRFELINPIPVTTTIQDNGFFEAVPYRDWQYPWDARNQFENRPLEGNNNRGGQPADKEKPKGRPVVGKIERMAEPQYLCLAATMERIEVQKWRNDHGNEAKLEYVMVSYAGSQFPTKEDWGYLNKVGQHAAQNAGVETFWVGCSCLGLKGELEENVYRICDVVRGAFSIVITVDGPVDFQNPQILPYKHLRDWGNRVWTLPELLLSPEHDDIQVYTNRRLDSCVQMNRRNFMRFWDDYGLVGQLIDHYEGSLILSPLELMTIALRCLQNREATEYLPGDLSYALMGLLRQRPHARPTDSAFQAFARLSLANDSNMLLERLICLLPHSPYDRWNSLHDHWDASLWDIYPKTQVCGIGENDCVILDGARAANIRWKSFSRVVLRGNDSWKRMLARIIVSLLGPLFVLWIIFVAALESLEMGAWPIAVGTVLIIAPVILLSPYLVRKLYVGKVWSAQPWFFGVEGYMSLPDLERHLFGASLGRLSWSVTGSSLSRHKAENSQDFKDICQGQDPSTYLDIKARIQKAKTSTGGEEKIFTLVDTYTMTVTLFSAIKPPVAVIACGEEGGMQRALLCSYEWTNNTFYRETVLRMETRVYWRMSPMARVRLGLQSRRQLDV